MGASASPSPSPSPSPSLQRAWIRAALLFGVVYLAAGLVFGLLAGAAASDQLRSAWRLMAWLVSAIAYALHIRYEYVRLHNPSVTAARHVAIAVAMGAFGLALAANIHALTAGPTQRAPVRLALGPLPLLTAVPG